MSDYIDCFVFIFPYSNSAKAYSEHAKACFGGAKAYFELYYGCFYLSKALFVLDFALFCCNKACFVLDSSCFDYLGLNLILEMVLYWGESASKIEKR